MGKKRGFLAGLFVFVGVLLTLLSSAASYAQTATITLPASQTQRFLAHIDNITGIVTSYEGTGIDQINYYSVTTEFRQNFHRYRFDHPNIPNSAITNIQLSFIASKHAFVTSDAYLRVVIPTDTCTSGLGWGVLNSSEYGVVANCIQSGAYLVSDYQITSSTTVQRDFSNTTTPNLTTLLQNPSSISAAVYSHIFFTETDINQSMTATLTYDVTSITTNTICCNQTLVGVTNPPVLTGSIPAGGNYVSYTYQWQLSLDNLTWSNISGATAVNYDPPTISQTTYYRRVVNSGPSTPSTSDVITLMVLPPIVGNTICCDQSFVNVTTADPVNLTGSVPTGGTGLYSYQWQWSLNGSSWSNIIGSISQNYDPNLIMQTTYYRRVVNSGAGTSTSNVITVSVITPITNNNICCDEDLVGATDPSVLTGSTPAGGDYLNYTYQWQSSLDNSTWSNVSRATAINYDPPTISQTTYYRRIINSGPSTPSRSNVVTLKVWPPIAGNTICCDQSFVNVTTADPANLTGSVPTGGTGLYSYVWYSSSNGSTWQGVGAPPFGQNIDPNLITQTTYYQRVVDSGSGGSFSNIITVTIIKPITNNNICCDQFGYAGPGYATNPSNLIGELPLGGYGGYTYQWQLSSDNTLWTSISGAIAQSYDPTSLSQTTYYRRIVNSGSLTSASAALKITISPGPAVDANIPTLPEWGQIALALLLLTGMLVRHRA